MARRDFADHPRDLRAVEGASEITLWCERRLQGGRNSGRAVAMMKQRRLRAALGERPHEVERGRVGPVQVLEGERDGCERAPARTQAASAASCRRRNSSGASFAARPCRQRDVDQRGEQGRIFGGVEADQPQRALEVGEALLRGSLRRRTAARPHSAIGCSGVFCRSCDALHSTQVCGVSAEPRAELLDEPRLADAGLADDEHELALACPRALPAAREQAELLLATDERRQRPRAAPSAAAARAHDADRARPAPATPLSSRAPLSSATKRPATWRCTSAVTSTEPGSATAWTRAATFGASPNTSPVASTTTGPDSRPMRAASSGAPLRGVPGVEVGERALDRERGPHRALGVVLLRLRIAEERHQPVAELLQHMAAKPRHRGRGFVEIGVDEVAPVLRVEPRREARRADEIAEHHRDRAALARVETSGGAGSGGGRQAASVGGRAGQGGDCGEQPAPIADR